MVREFGIVVTMNVSAVWEKMKEVDSRHRRSKTNIDGVGGDDGMLSLVVAYPKSVARCLQHRNADADEVVVVIDLLLFRLD